MTEIEKMLRERIEFLERRIGELEYPEGYVGAMAALSRLRRALATIQEPHPAHSPGIEPTAADHLAAILEDLKALIDFRFRQIGVFLGEPQ